MEDSVVAGDPPPPPDLSTDDFASLPFDPQFFSSQEAAMAGAGDSFLSDLGFAFASDDGFDYDLTFDDLDNLYLPSDADDLLFDPALASDSNPMPKLDSPETGGSVISKGSEEGFVVSGGHHDHQFSENSGQRLSSQGSKSSPAHSGSSDRDVSSNLTDEKLKTEGGVTKRKKESSFGEEAKKSLKYRRLEIGGGGDDDEDEKKKKARLMRNRESAQLSRQRKKHYVEELKDKVRAMHATITDLNGKLSYIMAENASLKQQLSGAPPPPGMYPMQQPMGYPWMMPYSPYVVNPNGSQVPLVPIPRLKSQQPAAAPKTKKKSESKSKMKKVASVSLLGMLFFVLLFGGLVPMVNVGFGGMGDRFYDRQRPKVLTIKGRLNGSEESIPRGRFDVSSRIHERTPKLKEQTVPGAGNGSEPLAASLYVPRNDKMVKIDGNLIIHSVLASEKAKEYNKKSREARVERAKSLVSALAIPEAGVSGGRRTPLYRTSAGERKALAAGSADGKLQQWFREGLAGPLLSSGMCTEVFQFDVSAANPGGMIPASSVAIISEHDSNAARLNRVGNRRVLPGARAIPLTGSVHNVTNEGRAIHNQSSSNVFQGRNSSMVVSVLVDPREAGDIDVDGMIKPKSLSRVFVVLLLDNVNLEWWSFELLILLSGLLPNPVLETSVLSVCLQTITTLYAIPYGFGAAVSTRVSNELGAGNPRAARIATHAAMFLAITESFSSDKDVIENVTTMAALVCLSVLLDSFQGVLTGISRRCGWQHIGAYINLGAFYLCGIPVAAALAFWFQLRGKGLWIGIQVGALVQSALLAFVATRTNWKKQASMARERIFGANNAEAKRLLH